MTEVPLTPDRMARLQEWFDRLVEVSPEEQAGSLEHLRGEDADLAARLGGLLEAHRRTGRVLERPVAAGAFRGLDPDDDRWIGARVGTYQVVRRIGMGGMGTVYEAVRADAQYERRVAVKVLRHQTADEAIRERFRHERQILANLNHPHIAALLDGGVTPDGQPYFVMEYIEGEPITWWADARSLSIRSRLELFLQVCDAVAHAHQALVVHRDLKPGNILIAEGGVAKLLDFGIAKLVPDGDDAEGATVTQLGARAFTPEYASPEQVQGRPVGTRSDVYSLGVVLFELLAGRRPFNLQGRSAGEIERIVTDTAPPAPSVVPDDARAIQLALGSARGARRQLAGDLDAIVLKALRKEPERRYGSVAELADDLRAHLDGHPVLARPDSLGYRFGRLVRRRKLESAAVGLAVASLLGGIVLSTAQARAAERARDRATEVTSFLTTMLRAARPTALGREVLVREVLDSAAVHANELRDRPELEAEIRDIIGGTYRGLGEFALAEGQFRRMVAIARQRAPQGDSTTVSAMTALSTILELQGRYLEADSVLREATPLLERYWGKGRGLIDHLDLRGRLLARMGRLAEARPLLARALELQFTITPVDDDELSYSYANLGVTTSRLGDHVAAETLLVAGAEAARRYHGAVHPQVAALLSPLAGVQGMLGKVAAAESTYQEALAIRAKLLGTEHLDYAWTLGNYADLLVDNGRPAEAAAMARQVLALRDPNAENVHPNFGTALSVLGRALAQLDSLEAGIGMLREALEVRRASLPPGHYIIHTTRGLLGEHLARAGRFPEAESLLLESNAALLDTQGPDSPDTRQARERLVRLYESWNRPAEAARWRTALEERSTPGPRG